MKVLIIAGGHGTRLWPLSRRSKPKQLQPLLSSQSLLQDTFTRAQGIASPADTYVVVSDHFQLEQVREQLPALPPEHILQEPMGKNTLAAIAFGASALSRAGFDYETMCVLYADHAIANPDLLHDALRRGESFLEQSPDHLLIVGVTPTYAEPGYGYIEKGTLIADDIYEVYGFREKPSRDVAHEFVKHGTHLWNAGLFQWKVGTFLDRVRNNAPAHEPILDAQTPEELASAYAAAPAIAIDYGIFEKGDRLATMSLDLAWRDIGHWEAVKEHTRQGDGVTVLRGKHAGVGTTNTLVLSETDRLIATVGLDNIIIVDTPDALLVCRADQAQSLRDVVEIIAEDESSATLL